MPRCNSCGAFTKKPVIEESARHQNVLCPMCAAEREFKLSGELSVDDFEPVSFWDRLKAKFRGLFGR